MQDDFTGQTPDSVTTDPYWTTEETETGETPEEQVVAIDGKDYRLSELKEFVSGGMREKDYRQKTMELSEQRKELEQLRDAAEAWQMIQNSPELVQALQAKVVELLQGQPGGAPEAPAGPETSFPGMGPETPEWKPAVDGLQNQMAGILGAYDQRFQEYNKYLWDQWYAQREAYAQGQMERLREKYPWAYPDEVVATYRNDAEANLEELAKQSHEHWYNFANERQKTDLEKRKANATARIATQGMRGATPAVPTKVPKDWDEAASSARERLEKLSSFFGK